MRILNLIWALLLMTHVTVAAKVIKVACVGNSITYGANILNREQNSYPAQLQAYLGGEYEVRNYGVSGTTLLSKGDYPYTATPAYRQALDFQPDIVLIKLGTNDTKPQNWRFHHEFEADYQKLIEQFRNLDSHPRIILLVPVRCFLTDETSISPLRISQSVRPAVEQIAWKNGLEILNLYSLFGDNWEPHLMPDRLHPSAIGAGRMAQVIGAYLKQAYATCHTQDMPFLKDAATFNFHGYCGYDFRFEGANCKIVKPYGEAPGKPWVIRARFWGHEPQTDIALLEHGFHIMYCDVADMYGSPEAVKRWNRFYKMMVKQGFRRQVVLEGMSRGGLIVYNWAAENPNKVACIYADAPVMDIKSWPMGCGKGQESADDTKRMLSAYGFADEEEARAWSHNPLDRAKVIARAKIPCLHVVGDADTVVPVDENTTPFVTAMQKYGGQIKVVHKPGIGHHPHSLANPRTIVDFILRATGLYVNECTHAVPGNEYREGAGWKPGTEWHAQAEDIRQTLKGRHLKLLWLGNSISQGWGGRRAAVTYKPGLEVMDSTAWETAGISGDGTQHLLWRLQHDDYNVCRPENVVIAIGVNNLIGGYDEPEDVAEGIIKVTEEAERQFPQARIWVLGLLPAGKDAESRLRMQANAVHELLQKHEFGRARYVNPSAWFLTEDRKARSDYYIGDYIHLSTEGYRRWAEEVKKMTGM